MSQGDEFLIACPFLRDLSYDGQYLFEMVEGADFHAPFAWDEPSVGTLPNYGHAWMQLALSGLAGRRCGRGMRHEARLPAMDCRKGGRRPGRVGHRRLVPVERFHKLNGAHTIDLSRVE